MFEAVDISLESARSIVSAAVARSEEIGWRMDVAVVDAGAIGVSGDSVENDPLVAEAGATLHLD